MTTDTIENFPSELDVVDLDIKYTVTLIFKDNVKVVVEGLNQHQRERLEAAQLEINRGGCAMLLEITWPISEKET